MRDELRQTTFNPDKHPCEDVYRDWKSYHLETVLINVLDSGADDGAITEGRMPD